MSSKEYEYVAFIDEAGDPGLDTVKPLDENGSSEWLILAGVLIRASNEHLVKTWDRELRIAGGRKPEHQIHFRFLTDNQKLAVCKKLAEFPQRTFVVASNKKNMRRYKNDFAQRASDELTGRLQSHAWLHHWLFRALLERMTDYAERRALSEDRPRATIKLEISRCGGIYYREMFAYFKKLRQQSIQGEHWLPGKIRWSALDFDLMHHYLHKTRSGLVLSDIAASAFFTACDRVDRNRAPNPLPAFQLDQCMARRTGRVDDLAVGYGVKLFPDFKEAGLDDEQARIFKHYGYR
ncbi:MAG: DUF3800 domain-containing protein [Alphaproteobacteria bacterium]|nr:MAG: DUF3800 domain-containing protein [Alphaproteobacteria bacterium]